MIIKGSGCFPSLYFFYSRSQEVIVIHTRVIYIYHIHSSTAGMTATTYYYYYCYYYYVHCRRYAFVLLLLDVCDALAHNARRSDQESQLSDNLQTPTHDQPAIVKNSIELLKQTFVGASVNHKYAPPAYARDIRFAFGQVVGLTVLIAHACATGECSVFFFIFFPFSFYSSPCHHRLVTYLTHPFLYLSISLSTTP